MKTSWKPILENQDLLTAKAILQDIVTNLEEKNYADPGSSLFTGKAGQSLFFAYLATATQDERYLEYATDLISECFDDIGSEEMIYSLCTGFTGISWAFYHLVEKDYIDADANLVLEEIDGYSAMAAVKDVEHRGIDFLHGGLGAGLYFTGRVPENASPQVLEKIIDLLDQNAEVDSNGIKWFNETMLAMAKDKTKREYSLGLSHGMPSVIAFLARVYAEGIRPEKCRKLLDGSINWLLKQELPEGSKSHFPGVVEEGVAPLESRVAWCYGDPGIALALWQAGEATATEAWKQKAIELIHHAATRTRAEEHYVIDGGLCHGAAGVAHIFNRFYQATGNTAFKEAAVFWLGELFKHQRFDDGLAGFKAYNPMIGEWVNDSGLLEGITGIGLVLLAATTDTEPEWDRCMLMS